jgi:hypothetical protein
MSDPRITDEAWHRTPSQGPWGHHIHSTPRITDEAVEAIAIRVAPAMSMGLAWDELGEVLQNFWLNRSRAALEAALPHLAPQPVVDREALARAWEQGWRRGVLDTSESTDASATTNPYAVLARMNGGAS